MIEDTLLKETLKPLPLFLRSQIYSNVKRKMIEFKLGEIDEKTSEREIVLTILQELYDQLVEPLDFVKSILQSKQLTETKSFKVEFSEINFDSRLIEETKEFVLSYWRLVRELGFEGEIRPEGAKMKRG